MTPAFAAQACVNGVSVRPAQSSTSSLSKRPIAQAVAQRVITPPGVTPVTLGLASRRDTFNSPCSPHRWVGGVGGGVSDWKEWEDSCVHCLSEEVGVAATMSHAP